MKDNYKIPEMHEKAVFFSLSDNDVFTFGRPIKDRERLERILDEGFPLREIRGKDGMMVRDSVSRTMWPLGYNAEEAYHRIMLQANNDPYYLVFGLPHVLIEDIEMSIEEALNDAETPIVIPDTYHDARKWWAYAADTYAAEHSYLLLPRTIKGHIRMRDGAVFENKDFRITDR